MQIFRKILFPFSLLYKIITRVYHVLYDKGFLSSTSYEKPVICVGNLSVGGTGKSPMIEYLITLLNDDVRIAVLSRGYKRKTKGFKYVLEDDCARDVGDEPLQIKRKFKSITVAVCADRRAGIAVLLENNDVILLDDAFQHRKVKAGLNILLTSYNHLYVNDFILPTGNLREPKIGFKRADLVVVTKCPDKLTAVQQRQLESELGLMPRQKLFFSKIGYSEFIKNNKEMMPLNSLKDVVFTLVTGIANPSPLLSFLRTKGLKFEHLNFPDHHTFSESDLKLIASKPFVLTTEKDFMRLSDKIEKGSLYFLEIETVFIKQNTIFNEQVLNFVGI